MSKNNSHNGENWPYHEDPHGNMVPCESNPCTLHGGSDVYATSAEEAESAKHSGTMTGLTAISNASANTVNGEWPNKVFAGVNYNIYDGNGNYDIDNNNGNKAITFNIPGKESIAINNKEINDEIKRNPEKYKNFDANVNNLSRIYYYAHVSKPEDSYQWYKEYKMYGKNHGKYYRYKYPYEYKNSELKMEYVSKEVAEDSNNKLIQKQHEARELLSTLISKQYWSKI